MAAKKRSTKKAKKKAATRTSQNDVGAWSDSNAAHQALYMVLLRHKQIDVHMDYAVVGALKLSALPFWLNVATGTTKKTAAKAYASRMMNRLLQWFDSRPRAGNGQSERNEAYDQIEAMMTDANRHQVADLGNHLDALYRGW